MSNIEEQLDSISNTSIEEKKLSDEELINAYNKSEQLTIIPILKLIYNTIKLDYSSDFKIKPKISSNKEIPIGKIEISKPETPNVKYNIYLDIIDNDTYDLNAELLNANILSKNITNLMEETNEKLKTQLIQIITYLTQSAKIVFDNLKQKYIEILEYNIEMDYNTTIFLDKDLNKRLGIKIIKSIDL